MTREAINNSIWIVGLALQGTLLFLIFSRGIARRLPVFTALMAFYPLRSLVRFAFYSHLGPGTYATTYYWVSLADIVLQLAVAVEIGVHLLRACWGSMRMVAAGLFVLIPCVAWAATIFVCRLLPDNAPIPADRLQMFASMVMILLCVWAEVRPLAHLVRRVVLGFAVFAAVDLAATAGRTVAVVHRDAGAFAAWAYLLAGAYLLVVAYWIVALRRRSVEIRRAAAKPALVRSD